MKNHSFESTTTTTTTDDDDDSLWSLSSTEIALRLIGAIICIALIIVTIVGNVLVIIVVARFHRMRTVTNILLASLAIADITVASLVMPFTVVYDLYRYWPWGPVLCHFWISCDVMCCTASILHLCCVAIDRFWAITRPLRYRSLISKRRLFCCILIIWLCSAAISFIPIFSGWYHSQGPINIFTLEYVNECGLDVNRIYATISSLTSFYLPLPIMFYVYLRILLVAERQSREIKQLEQSLRQNANVSATNTKCNNLMDQSSSSSSSAAAAAAAMETSKRHAERSLRRRARQLITDTKAIRTLGIVMGVFCLCWLPFFIMYVISAYCDQCNISYELRSSITWLGYVNSALNPAIYAYLNKEFKMAFKRVIFCMPHCSNDNFDRDAMLDEYSGTSHRHGAGSSVVGGGLSSYQSQQHQQQQNRKISKNHHFDFMIDDEEQGGHRGGGSGGQHRLDILPLPPSTPGYITRTPSNATETPDWIILHAHHHHQQQKQQQQLHGSS
nr:probable G-protein coupled receptor No18 [Dermatophagoides farinae]